MTKDRECNLTDEEELTLLGLNEAVLALKISEIQYEGYLSQKKHWIYSECTFKEW